ncbi:unnamed protein product [Rotaria sp. Silwood2]|nr:unnamed protein product [Rotaria sp. Silwood2]
MSSNKRESNGTKPKIDTSKPHKSRRALSAAPTAAKSTSSAGESKATTTKKITSEATNLASSVAATSVSKPNASMITPSVTNVLAGDSSTSNTITATTKPSTFTVSLYALRYFIDSDNVKLQAVFGSKLVQDFKEIARLSKDKKRDYIPSVFQLSANIQIDVDDIPYILMGKVRHRCTDYYLHVEKSTLFFQNPKCDEIARRSINSKISSIQFLFDLRFPPGTDKAILVCLDSISDAIINVGSNIKNKIFIQEFERKFKEEYFLPYEYQIKTMQTINNPLIILIELYQRKEASHLVTRLLEICCDAINITHDELLQHTLERPSNNTLTYIILCENCFIKIPIRLNILDQLTKFWNIWEQKGLQARQIRCWQIFTFNQRYYFNEIWNIVEKFAKKKYSVNRLFDTQYQEMLRIIKLKENIVNCLNAYCSEDSDKANYLKLLQSMQLQIDDGAVHGIVVEPELKKLQPLAIRLSHVSKSNAWMHYYTKQLENKSSLLTINVDLPS